MQIIGIHFQNPGNTEMYIISVVRLRIGPDITTPAWIDRCTLNDNSHFIQLDINSTCSTLKNNTHMAHIHTSEDMHPYSNIGSSQPISAIFTMILLDTTIYGNTNSQYSIILILLLHIINVTDYWPMAREYLIWNAAAALQFWTAELKAHVLSSAIEQAYNAFFYTRSTHLLCQQSEEVLFGHLVTMLNAVFESKFVLEDEGYESGSETFNIATPL